MVILFTYAFIKQRDFEDILEFSKLFINNKHSLMHKALGWMLREVGKIDLMKKRKRDT
jgi:3-methyladenine DNA glycosylase AlkD